MPHSSKSASKQSSSVLYDAGTGLKLIAAIVFAIMVVVPVVYLVSRRSEVYNLPKFILANPIVGVIVLLGGLGVLWSIGLGVWMPLRNVLFPSRICGTFSGYRVADSSQGKKLIYISLGPKEVKALYNTTLENALSSARSGDDLEVSLGVRQFVIRIARR